MSRKSVSVIKKERVRDGEPVRLPTSRLFAGDEQSHAPARAAVEVPRQARVVESNSDYAILEVVCSCGNKMHIQCNFGDMAVDA